MLLGLTAACSSSSSSSTSASAGASSASASSGASSASASSASGKTYSLSFIQGVAGDGFYVTMGCGMQAEAKKLGDATVNIQGPAQFDATLQNPII
jgi:ribose transport system substrate-binding protein